MQQHIVEQSVALDGHPVGVHIVVDDTVGYGKRVGSNHGRTVLAPLDMETIQLGPVLDNRSGQAVVVRADYRHTLGLNREDTVGSILLEQTLPLGYRGLVGTSETAIDLHIGHPLQGSGQHIVATGHPHGTVGSALFGVARVVGRVDSLLQVAHGIVPARAQSVTVGLYIEVRIEQPLVLIGPDVDTVTGNTTTAAGIDKHHAGQRIAGSYRLLDRTERIVGKEVDIPAVVLLLVIGLARHVPETGIDELTSRTYAIFLVQRFRLVGSLETRTIRHVFVVGTQGLVQIGSLVAQHDASRGIPISIDGIGDFGTLVVDLYRIAVKRSIVDVYLVGQVAGRRGLTGIVAPEDVVIDLQRVGGRGSAGIEATPGIIGNGVADDVSRTVHGDTPGVVGMEHRVVDVAFVQVYGRPLLAGCPVGDKHAVANRRIRVTRINGGTGRPLARSIGGIPLEEGDTFYIYGGLFAILAGGIHRLVDVHEVFRVVAIAPDIGRVQNRIAQVVHGHVGTGDVVGIATPEGQALGHVAEILDIGFRHDKRVTALFILQVRHIFARSNLDILVFLVRTEQQHLYGLVDVRGSLFPRYTVVLLVRYGLGTLHIQDVTAEGCERYRLVLIGTDVDDTLFPLLHVDHVHTILFNNVVGIGLFGDTPLAVEGIGYILAPPLVLCGIIALTRTVEHHGVGGDGRALYRPVGVHHDVRIQFAGTAIGTAVDERRERRQREVGHGEVVFGTGIVAGESEARPHHCSVGLVEEYLEVAYRLVDIGSRGYNLPVIGIDALGIVVTPENRIGEVVARSRRRIDGAACRGPIARVAHDGVVDQLRLGTRLGIIARAYGCRIVIYHGVDNLRTATLAQVDGTARFAGSRVTAQDRAVNLDVAGIHGTTAKARLVEQQLAVAQGDGRQGTQGTAAVVGTQGVTLNQFQTVEKHPFAGIGIVVIGHMSRTGTTAYIARENRLVGVFEVFEQTVSVPVLARPFAGKGFTGVVLVGEREALGLVFGYNIDVFGQSSLTFLIDIIDRYIADGYCIGSLTIVIGSYGNNRKHISTGKRSTRIVRSRNHSPVDINLSRI